MAKKKITVLAEELLSGFLQEEGLELYHSEFVKEGKDWFLRIYIDKPEGEGYIGTEDCEKVSRFLSEKLDEADTVEQNNNQEVSSPGLDRPLRTAADFERSQATLQNVGVGDPANVQLDMYRAGSAAVEELVVTGALGSVSASRRSPPRRSIGTAIVR